MLNGRTTVTKIYKFEACHHLPHYEGACHRLHGHSYKLEVTLTGKVKDNTSTNSCGMIIDFKEVKTILELTAGKYDHSNLNDFFENPTAEIMVEKIANDIVGFLPNNVSLVSARLWETDTSYAEFIAE